MLNLSNGKCNFPSETNKVLIFLLDFPNREPTALPIL